eukprot:scaffold4990_cov387-Prasinococcus_capsulatus_cf.AAC.1
MSRCRVGGARLALSARSAFLSWAFGGRSRSSFFSLDSSAGLLAFEPSFVLASQTEISAETA